MPLLSPRQAQNRCFGDEEATITIRGNDRFADAEISSFEFSSRYCSANASFLADGTSRRKLLTNQLIFEVIQVLTQNDPHNGRNRRIGPTNRLFALFVKQPVGGLLCYGTRFRAFAGDADDGWGCVAEMK
jgi:hypothetical protein